MVKALLYILSPKTIKKKTIVYSFITNKLSYKTELSNNFYGFSLKNICVLQTVLQTKHDAQLKEYNV